MSQYCTPADLVTYGFPAKAAESILDAVKINMIVSVSAEADGELGRRFTLPLTATGPELVRVVAVISVWELLASRGFDSAALGNTPKERAAWARAWLKRVGDGELSPPGLVDSTPDVSEGGAFVVTDPRRDPL